MDIAIVIATNLKKLMMTNKEPLTIYSVVFEFPKGMMLKSYNMKTVHTMMTSLYQIIA